MKGYVAVILCVLFALVGAKVKDLHAHNTGMVKHIAQWTVEEKQGQSEHKDRLIALDGNRDWADMERGDVHGLAYRLNVSLERTYRFVSVEVVQTIKKLLRRMASYAATQGNISTDFYKTSPFLSGKDACEYYIFGMRRILI